MQIDFYWPTQVVFGCGSLNQVAKLTAPFGNRALLVTSAGAWKRSAAPMHIFNILRAAGVQVAVFDGVTGEANLDMVSAGLKMLRQHGCQVVVGLGGGSSIDTAKAVAGLATLEGDIRAYHTGRQPEHAGLPLIAIPTTAGSGAEATRNAVLIDPANGVKQSIRGDSWFPRVALVDPELTLSMAPDLTADTGSDALCQAIEAYTSIAASPITDGLAEQAITLVAQSLLAAYEHGDDINAREAMSLGSLLAGMAMSNARLGGVHGMAHPLGSHFHIPHGMVCGLLLPYIMRYNLDYAEVKYARIAGLFTGNQVRGSVRTLAEYALELVQGLLKAIHIPEHLAQFGVREEHLDLVIRETMPSGSTKHNARPLTEADVRNILVSAL
ncbi:MAG: iron-containing alcohol dehydrogenase family protein [Anaerolineae bacterium]